MTKNELINVVSQRSRLTNGQVKQVINKTLKAIEEELLIGKRKVVITGFGTFLVRTRVERKGRNPNTGETIIIPKHLGINFIPGKTLKRRLNK